MNDNNEKVEETNTEIIPKDDEVIVLEKKPDKPEEKIEQQINVGTLNVFTSPVKKLIHEPLKKRYEKHYHSEKKHGPKHLVADIILGSIVIALVAFIIFVVFWYGRGIVKLIDLEIKVAPFAIESGEDIVYRVNYVNNSKFVLQDAALTISLPDTFIARDIPDGFDTRTNTLKLGEVQPEGNGEIKITGQIIGEVGKDQKVTAAFNYKYKKGETPQSKIRIEQKLVSTQYKIENSVIKYDLNLPPELLDNQEFEFEINLKNLSLANNLSKISIVPQWPDGFELIESLPEYDSNKGWYFENLEAGNENIIKVKGQVAGLSEVTKKFVFNSFINYNNHDLLQQKNELDLPIAYPKFLLTVSSGKSNAYLGELIEYNINYNNQEDYSLNDVIISVPVNTTVFNIRSLQAGSGEYKDGIITWDKNKIADLAELESGNQGNLSFKIRLNSSINYRTVFVSKSEAVLFVQTNYKIISDDLESEVKLKGSTAVIKINSDLGATAFGRYYTAEGDQLGRGPLPPVAGRTTKYWIFLHALNNLNNVSNIKVSAKLPGNVEYTGRGSVANGESLTYNADTRTVSWQVGTINSFRSGGENSIGAAFELAFSPSIEQVGQEPVILSNIVITGIDASTGVSLQGYANAVTTNLHSDKIAGGKGKVEVE